MNTAQPMYEWSDIPWRKHERNVYKLQKRIYKASKRGNVKLVRRLQKLLINSRAAKCLAVRRVTQDNQGKKTAGVDGVKSLTPKQRLILVEKITLGSKVAPTRRVWIPKPGTEEKRPLGIPTMYDRALQGLIKLVLEPEWEARFEPNSYGFRPGRSCHDAIGAIFNAIRQKPKFVLDGDISKCFDRIDHEQLLRKLNTFPTIRRQIRAWLKAGVMDNDKLFPTSEGTPQGGVISPLLANIALHGMENEIKKIAETLNLKYPGGTQLSKRDKRNSLSLIRYADDFVILHEDLTVVQRCREHISEWLQDMRLELKPSKTRIIHTLNVLNQQKPGFEFLGFSIQQHRVGKYTSGKKSDGESLGFKTIITPSKTSQKTHYQKVAEVIEKHSGKSQIELIKNLNPIVIGWCNYFSTVPSKKVFNRLTSLVYWKLMKWGIKRHRNKGRKWIKTKYFQQKGGDSWVFSARYKSRNLELLKHREVPITDYVKVKGNASPFDGNLVYWSTRMGRHPEMPTRTAFLLKRQKGKCPYCGLTFRENDVIETDHIIPTSAGGRDEYKNLQLLHRHCHDNKSKTDSNIIKKHKAEKMIKEICKWFNKLDWMWIDDIPVKI
jgi:RNA-directed DNA polymerase